MMTRKASGCILHSLQAYGHLQVSSGAVSFATPQALRISTSRPFNFAAYQPAASMLHQHGPQLNTSLNISFLNTLALVGSSCSCGRFAPKPIRRPVHRRVSLVLNFTLHSIQSSKGPCSIHARKSRTSFIHKYLIHISWISKISRPASSFPLLIELLMNNSRILIARVCASFPYSTIEGPFSPPWLVPLAVNSEVGGGAPIASTSRNACCINRRMMFGPSTPTSLKVSSTSSLVR